MANKVLSIKMDEKDIERIKKYYEALVNSGFLSAKTMSLNGFYKHLLLDYLDDDIYRAFGAFLDKGINPKCLNPKQLNRDNKFSLVNTYNLDDETFELYLECVKEALQKGMDTLNNNASLFNEVTKAGIIVSGGFLCEMECVASATCDEEYSSFWNEKAVETMILQETELQEGGIQSDIEMIEQSSISEEAKQKLIKKLEEYEKNRRNNHAIIRHGKIIE